MNELAWFVAGGVAVALLLSLRPRHRPARAAPRRPATAPASAPAATPAPAVAPAPAAASEPADAPQPMKRTTNARQFAATLAEQLASLTSGVEGNAQLLIDSAADPSQVAHNAERLWHSVQRLRRLHDKLAAYVQPPAPTQDCTDLHALLQAVQQELAQGQLGLMMASHVPKPTPPVQGAPAMLHRALVGLCAALRHLERGAERLSVSAEADFDADHPSVHLELHLEWGEEPQRSRASAPDLPAFELELGAAQHLLFSLGGTVQVMHQRGKQAQALVTLLPAAPAAEPAELPQLEEALVEIPRPTHPFAGVLLIEHDPEVRALLASELKAAGRAVFVCPDPLAARTLLQATPERFELLIVDRDAQLEQDGPLATAAAALAPALKLCVISSSDSALGELPANVHRIQKPFGVLELRAAPKLALAD